MKKLAAIMFLTAAMTLSAASQVTSARHIAIFAPIPITESVDVVAYARGFDGSLLACPLPSRNNSTFVGECRNVASFRPVVFFTVTSRAHPERVFFYDAASVPYYVVELEQKSKRFRLVFPSSAP